MLMKANLIKFSRSLKKRHENIKGIYKEEVKRKWKRDMREQGMGKNIIKMHFIHVEICQRKIEMLSIGLDEMVQ